MCDAKLCGLFVLDCWNARAAAADTDFGGQNVVRAVTFVASEVCFVLDVPKTAKKQNKTQCLWQRLHSSRATLYENTNVYYRQMKPAVIHFCDFVCTHAFSIQLYDKQIPVNVARWAF